MVKTSAGSSALRKGRVMTSLKKERKHGNHRPNTMLSALPHGPEPREFPLGVSTKSISLSVRLFLSSLSDGVRCGKLVEAPAHFSLLVEIVECLCSWAWYTSGLSWVYCRSV